MQGEYRGDFTRDTFNPKKHFSRVLLQQGRVMLDADFNEQGAILLHYLQTLAEDLIGPHGGPADVLDTSGKVALKNLGFEIIVDGARIDEFSELTSQEKASLQGMLTNSKPPIIIGKGRYYVDGKLCENENFLPFSKQADHPLPGQVPGPGTYLIYLDVWERHITHIEYGKIREVALSGGVDTATRAQLIWQMKFAGKMPDETNIPAGITRDDVAESWDQWREKWQPAKRGILKAQVKPQEVSTDPCITSPESRYRGAENQLYRVEIHRPGKSWDGGLDGNRKPAGNAGNAATFKWSRDNGSVSFPTRKLVDKVVTLEHLGHDRRLSLEPGDWVEILDDDYVLRGEAGPLVQVDMVDQAELTVTLRSDPTGFTYNGTKHPQLRRWDHKAAGPARDELQLQGGAVLIKEGTSESDWIELEDGIQIQLQQSTSPYNQYRTGDYWLIPARTATGDVEWPKIKDAQNKLVPDVRPPHGVEHHYAPLAIISVDGSGGVTVETDLRRKIEPLGKPLP
jgi:hypothetical protein